MPSNHLILCHLLLLLPSAFPSISLFQWVGSSHQVGKILKLQHQSFQIAFRVDSLSVLQFDQLSLMCLMSIFMLFVIVWAMKSKCNFHLILKVLAFFFNFFFCPSYFIVWYCSTQGPETCSFFLNLCSSVLQINNFHISAPNLLTFYSVTCNLLKHSVFLNFC